MSSKLPSPFLLWILFVLLISFRQSSGANLTRTICYSGSLIYQSITQVCEEMNPGYTGTWYCAKTDVCESFMSSSRECMSTKGCAREDECYTTGVSTGSFYDGSIVLSNTIGSLPAGMKIRPMCCLNKSKFPTDDATISWASGVICNSATRRVQGFWGLALTAVVAAYLSIRPPR